VVIAPYAVNKPAIDYAATYPPQNAFNMPFLSGATIRFAAPVAAGSFDWLSEGDIRNIEITAVDSQNNSIGAPGQVEALFDPPELAGGGMILTLRPDAGRMDSSGLKNSLEGATIRIVLSNTIEGADGSLIMSGQYLAYSVTTATGMVNTRLAGLDVKIDGTQLSLPDFSFGMNTFQYSINVYAGTNMTLRPTSAHVPASQVEITVDGTPVASGAETTAITLQPGKKEYHIYVAPEVGSGDTYTLTVNNYPASTAPTVTLTPGAGQISVSWAPVVGGASGYEIRYSQGSDPAGGTLRDVTDGAAISAAITDLSAGQTYNVWVRAYAGSGNDKLYGSYSAVKSATTYSSTARLSNLTVGSGTLSPSFNEETFSYTLDVLDQATLSVAPTAKSGGSTAMRITNLANTSGTAFSSGDGIVNGKNTIAITVTPQAGTDQTYTLTVNNLPATLPVATVTAGVQSPNGKLTVSWPQVNGTDSYKVYYGQGSNPVYSIEWTGTISGSSPKTAIITNANITADTTFYVWVRAVAGTGSYAVEGPYSADRSARTPAKDPRLSALALSGYTLSPPFNPDVTSYEITQDIPNNISSLSSDKFQTSVYSSGAAVLVSANLNVGLTPCTVTVTTLYDTTETYTIRVYRKPPAPVWPGTVFTNHVPGGVNVNLPSLTGGISGYEVYQNTMANTLAGGYAFPATAASVSTSGMTAENTYYYYLRSYKDDAVNNRRVYSDYNTAYKTLKTYTTLDNLSVATFGLTNTFDPQYNSPETQVNYSTPSISVTPTYNQSGQGISSVTVNGVGTSSGTARSITLTFNSADPTADGFWNLSINNAVTVTAEHPSFKRTYTLNVTKKGIQIGSGKDFDTLPLALAGNDVVYLATGQTIDLDAAYTILAGFTKTIRTRGTGEVKIRPTKNNESVNSGAAFIVRGTLNLNGGNSSGQLIVCPQDSTTSGSPLIAVGDRSQTEALSPGSEGTLGTLNMYNGTAVQDRIRGIYPTGSAGVDIYGGTLNMYGGEITENTGTAESATAWGGGVYLGRNGIFNGYGGSITGNSPNDVMNYGSMGAYNNSGTVVTNYTWY
jgi:hypothetical protein